MKLHIQFVVSNVYTLFYLLMRGGLHLLLGDQSVGESIDGESGMMDNIIH